MLDESLQEAKSWRESNQFLGILLSTGLIGLLVSIYQSDWALRIQPDGFVLGFFPILGVVWMLLSSIMIVVDHARTEQYGEIEEYAPTSWVWIFGLATGWFGYMQLLLYFGYFLTTFLYLSLLLRLTGIKSFRMIVGSSAACVGVVFILFFAIGITLPMGQLWS